MCRRLGWNEVKSYKSAPSFDLEPQIEINLIPSPLPQLFGAIQMKMARPGDEA